MKPQFALALALLMATCALAQSDPQTSKAGSGHRTSTAPVAKQLEDMKDAISAQQEQIQQLQQQISARDAAIQKLQQQIANMPPPQPPAPAAPGCCDEVSGLQHDVTDLKTVSTNTAQEMQETQKRLSALESPTAIHYKGITITPGGFLAAETVWRQRGEGAGINTNLNGIPYPGANNAHISEFYGSGRQSRVALLAQGKLDNMTMSGYYEADFLSAGVTSNNNQSNSYTMRQRQVWAQAALKSGWTFTGGQQWSLVTETKKGLDNRTEALPMTIDPQYTVGFSWARQYGFRVTKNYENRVWFGFSVENSQETVTAHGNVNNYLIGQPGNGGGLYNGGIASCSTNAAGVTTCSPLTTYSYNPSPDFIGKVAFEPSFGGHYEIFGVATQFRDRIFPTSASGSTVSATGASNDSTWTGGGGGNARWSFFQKHVDVGIHALAGRGIGRYGTSGLSDVTVRPDGTLAPITSYQGLFTLEYHSPHWDWYGNGGIEYADRTQFLNPFTGQSTFGKPVIGYGAVDLSNLSCGKESTPGTSFSTGFSPSGCSADTKDIIEGTAGFWYKFYNGPKGRLQMGLQYSYLTKTAWGGTGGKSPAPTIQNPTALDNMFFTSFRYYLP